MNHYLISTMLCLETVMQSQQQRWWWKSMNMKRVAVRVQHFHILTHLTISEAIEQYTDYLVKFIKQLVRNTVLLIKLAVDYFCSWWTLKVDEAVHKARETWRHENHDKKIMKMNRHKKKSYVKLKYCNSEIAFIK